MISLETENNHLKELNHELKEQLNIVNKQNKSLLDSVINELYSFPIASFSNISSDLSMESTLLNASMNNIYISIPVKIDKSIIDVEPSTTSFIQSASITYKKDDLILRDGKDLPVNSHLTLSYYPTTQPVDEYRGSIQHIWEA